MRSLTSRGPLRPGDVSSPLRGTTPRAPPRPLPSLLARAWPSACPHPPWADSASPPLSTPAAACQCLPTRCSYITPCLSSRSRTTRTDINSPPGIWSTCRAVSPPAMRPREASRSAVTATGIVHMAFMTRTPPAASRMAAPGRCIHHRLIRTMAALPRARAGSSTAGVTSADRAPQYTVKAPGTRRAEVTTRRPARVLARACSLPATTTRAGTGSRSTRRRQGPARVQVTGHHSERLTRPRRCNRGFPASRRSKRGRHRPSRRPCHRRARN